MMEVCIKLFGSMLKRVPARIRTGKRNAGMAGAVVISLFPNSYCQPKLAIRRFPVKLIIFKRLQVKGLNLSDKFLFFGL